MLKYLLLAALLGPLGANAQGLSCRSLLGEIEAKYRTGGISNPVLTIVEATATAARGRVVGTCEHGSKKIIYIPSGNPSSQRQPESILTECKDGSVSIGGTCGSN
jgi:hypothetical protein